MIENINKIAVIGAGTMGQGIAQLCLSKNLQVILCDKIQNSLDKAKSAISKQFERGIEKGRNSAAERDHWLDNLLFSDALNPAAEAGVIIEAVFEDLDLKKSLWGKIAEIAARDALLASNTSCLSIDEMAVGISHPGRFLGLHFFNPAPVMKLLEIVRGSQTLSQTLERAQDFAQLLGKEAIVVKDSPGFATSRLGNALAVEAMRMLETEVAKAEDIDKAMKLGYGHPMGPLELTDLVGLDIRKNILENLSQNLDAPHLQPPKILLDLVAQGKLGKKTGQGFFDWCARK